MCRNQVSLTSPDWREATAQTCLSPTGCYEFEFISNQSEVFEDFENWIADIVNPDFISTFNISYSNTINNLEEQHTCDKVEICYTTFDSNHPKRAALNHLTQIAVSILNETNAPHHYNALCWILTEDEFF